MCDQYVCDHYICDECLEEFQNRFAHVRGRDEDFIRWFHEFIDQPYEPDETDGKTVEEFLEAWKVDR